VDIMQEHGTGKRDPLAGRARAIGSSPEGVFEALPPRIEALSPIGAGDTALVLRLEHGKEEIIFEALRWGVATGTAAANSRHGVPELRRLPRSL
jgi:fructose-1-phosphate kinase PfkB-like protein